MDLWGLPRHALGVAPASVYGSLTIAGRVYVCPRIVISEDPMSPPTSERRRPYLSPGHSEGRGVRPISLVHKAGVGAGSSDPVDSLWVTEAVVD